MNLLLELETLTFFLSEMGRSSMQKISEDIIELKSTINQLDTTDIYRLHHPTRARYIFFSGTGGKFAKLDQGHKTHLNKLKRIGIIHYLLSDHSEIKADVNN